MSETTAVLLAGGKGTRLAPYTLTIPKPLVPIGDYPILEIIIRQLQKRGINRLQIAVNHQAKLISDYFGDGKQFGVDIKYTLEQTPLGTMGPLSIMSENLPENFLVMNGDVLTDIPFDSFLSEHNKRGSIFSIAGKQRQNKVDYGVLHISPDGILTGFEEKPTIDYAVSMGVYAVSKRVLDYIPKGEHFGFDQLMLRLLHAGENVHVSIYDGYWNDIGRPSDYEKALLDFKDMQEVFL